jgi:hypothetical protein
VIVGVAVGGRVRVGEGVNEGVTGSCVIRFASSVWVCLEVGVAGSVLSTAGVTVGSSLVESLGVNGIDVAVGV